MAKRFTRAGKIESYARFGLLRDEAALLNRAAIMEERSLGEFCRVAALQRARVVVASGDYAALMPRLMAELAEVDKQET
jgi:uncharacterized protein (DUF1778 family)